jgi:Tfp pilus assembly protein PilF
VSLSAGERVCTDDTLRLDGGSRALLVLPDGGTIRLDEHTTLNLAEPPSGDGSLLELLRGILHIISRDPRSLTFKTPYANAGLEGTEFDIRVDDERRLTEVVVLEGEVVVTTPNGELKVASDHVATALDGQAPSATPIENTIERMRWASYYPSLIDQPLPAPDEAPLPAQQTDPDFYAYRAAARLATAQLAGAADDIATVLRLDSRNAIALSLDSLLALARADREMARNRVAEALSGDAKSVVARLASSYVEQSAGNLVAAERAVREALELEPNNAIVLTRLAEIALAQDDTRTAIATATRARDLAPTRSGPLVVLGFASLRAFDTAGAERAFAAAVDLERDAPLPRLGLGLVSIQRGDLVAGRQHIELAVILDPANPLTRSYMAKAYDAEKRAELPGTQLDLAKDFDAFDPTAWLYSSLQKLRNNRPVEALHDFRQAARINGDVPAFRSSLLLDDDLATRSAAVARIHTELGMGQLALLGAWSALSKDPADFTGHRLLSDAYAAEPRHEIARVSELHVSQLHQPANVAPIKPQLGQQNLVLAQRAGPSSTSFDEFSSPVVANGLKLRASGAAGGNDTDGHDVSLAGLHDRVSYSAGHYRFSTDGFRENNDYDQEVANAFFQYRPTVDTNLQAELRSSHAEYGDLNSRFNRELYIPFARFDEEVDSLRLGAKQQLTPQHALLGSVIYQDVVGGIRAGEAFATTIDRDAYNVDVQHVYSPGSFSLQSGFLAARESEQETTTASDPFGTSFTAVEDHTSRQLGLYTYAYFDPTSTVTVTAGVSFDSIDNPDSDEHATNPKLGVTWRPTTSTTVRAAAFQTLFGTLSTSTQNVQPRIEPVQVAGFTQLLFGGTADRTSVHGLAVEHELSAKLLVGWQADVRETDRTAIDITGLPVEFALNERAQKAYLYWLPGDNVSVAARYEHGRYSSAPDPLLGYSQMSMDRLPVELRFFARRGFTIGTRATHVRQEGEFQTDFFQPPTLAHGEDEFWVLDAFVGYRLPNRRGLLSLNADNLLDEDFQFQDIDPSNPSLFPERLISLRFTLSFE